jgi:membrane-bound lytic murein transglycosylase MltF
MMNADLSWPSDRRRRAFQSSMILSDKEIRVRKSSSYFTHLTALSDAFVALVARGLYPDSNRPISEDLEDEELMEMVNAGLLPYVVVDDFKAKIWATIFAKLVVRDALAVNSGGSIAWAIRKNSPLLRAELNRFVAANKIGTLFGNIMKQRYFTDSTLLKAAFEAKTSHDSTTFWRRSGAMATSTRLILSC